jgi:hypothetical protein
MLLGFILCVCVCHSSDLYFEGERAHKLVVKYPVSSSSLFPYLFPYAFSPSCFTSIVLCGRGKIGHHIHVQV